MPVTVSLLELVSISGTKPAWPSEFRGFIETIESDYEDRTNYLVLADWLRDQDEEWLEKACRLIGKNIPMCVRPRQGYYRGTWEIELPPWLSNIEHGIHYAIDTAAGPIGNLAYKLRKLAEELA